MGVKIKKYSALQTKLEDKGFQKSAIDKIESMKPMKKGGMMKKKAKSGGSFPDLNKDGKITKADILKGRGVIAKNGMKMKKQAATAIAMKKASKAPKAMMKMGGKCKNGC
jgi:hypothetical protein